MGVQSVPFFQLLATYRVPRYWPPNEYSLMTAGPWCFAGWPRWRLNRACIKKLLVKSMA
jgi:hypothetical protein